jgi:uncharacterized beta-barrel protein YwiB (DUF1934 family)
MGLAKQFNDVIQKQLNVFAAWLPVSNTFQLGDYGVLDDGVFAKMGNIKEFGIDNIIREQGKEAKLDFTSDSTRVVNFAAGAQVNVIPEGAVDAKVTFHFEKAQSMLVKSPAVNVQQMQNVNEIGQKLMNNSKWDSKFKIVYQVYSAQDAAILSTITAGTEISFTGDAKALQKLNVGNASVGFTSNNKLGLDLQGKEGTIGLGLFQIVKGGVLGMGKKKVAILDDEEVPLEIAYPKDAAFATNDL